MFIRNPRLVFNGPEGAAVGGPSAPSPGNNEPGTASGGTVVTAPATEAEAADYKAKYEASLQHSREWESRAKANYEKAQKFDAAEAEKKTEIEKANDRAAAAEKLAADSSATVLRLTVATDNGITKEELPLLTAATAEGLAKQVAAINALRAGIEPAPGASAAQAGITGGGTGPVTRAKTLTEAVAAAVASK